MKRCSLLLITREIHIKRTTYYLTQSEWTSLKCLQVINAREDEEEENLLTLLVRMEIGAVTIEKSMKALQEN